MALGLQYRVGLVGRFRSRLLRLCRARPYMTLVLTVARNRPTTYILGLTLPFPLAWPGVVSAMVAGAHRGGRSALDTLARHYFSIVTLARCYVLLRRHASRAAVNATTGLRSVRPDGRCPGARLLELFILYLGLCIAVLIIVFAADHALNGQPFRPRTAQPARGRAWQPQRSGETST